MENGVKQQLFSLPERLKSFKKWPFSDKDKCNVQDVAEAGFYSIATGEDDADAVKCFLCGKELVGWKESDDPWEEHKSHAPKCAFAKLGKKEDDLLLTEYLSFAKQYMINEIKQIAETAKKQIDERAELIRQRTLRK